MDTTQCLPCSTKDNKYIPRDCYVAIYDCGPYHLKPSCDGWEEMKLSLPNCVPSEAKEIELYLSVQTGWQPGGVSWKAEACAYTQQINEVGRIDKFEKRLLFHPFANCPIWVCNSENMCLPITKERMVHVYVCPNPPPKIVYKWSIDISIKLTGYRT